MKVLVFGTVCLDRLRTVGSIPEPGGYVEIIDEELFLGGEAANTACALHEWGVSIALMPNPIGTDEAGIALLRLAEKRGIQLVVRSGVATPFCDIYVTPDSERTMFGFGFTSLAPTVRIEFPKDAAEWFTAEPNFGATAREAAVQANARGCQLYLMDFNEPDDPIPPGSWWQSSTDWVGKRGDARLNAQFASEQARRFQCHAALTDGAFGVYYAPPSGEAVHIPALPSNGLVDATGAGDRFRAGMLYGLTQEWRIEDCLRYASAAGARKLAAKGGSAPVDSPEAIRAWAGL